MKLTPWFTALKTSFARGLVERPRQRLRRQRVFQPLCQLEQLEDRVMLTNDLFIITHGYEYFGDFPTWVYDMATAINSRIDDPVSTADGPDVGSIPDAIENSRVQYNDNPNSAVTPSPFLLFDWADQSNNPNVDSFTGHGWAELAGIR